MVGTLVMGFSVILIIALTIVAWIKNRIIIAQDEAAIIFGRQSKLIDPETGEAKIVNSRVISKGGGTFKMPFLEKAMFVDLKIIEIQLDVTDLPSANFVKVDVDALAIVKVRDSESAIRTAASKFGDFQKRENKEKLERALFEILQGHLRSTISRLTPEELISERDKFNQQIQDASGDRLAQLGIQILDFTIKGIKDKVGYLDKLREDAEEEMRKNVDIQVSNSQRKREDEVAKNNIKIAQYQAEQRIVEESKRSEMEMAAIKANEEIEMAQKAQEIEIKKQDIILKKEQNRREELDYTLDKQKVIIEGEAKAARAVLEAKSTETIAKANAEAVRMEGIAAAEAQRAMANAFEKLDDRSQVLFILDKLPTVLDEVLKENRVSAIFGELAKPMEQIDSVKIFDFGGGNNDGSPIERFAQTGPKLLFNMITQLKELGLQEFLSAAKLDTELLSQNGKES